MKKIILNAQEKKLRNELELQKILFSVETLRVYDVIVGDYGIELKRGNDFLASIYDKRIFTQIEKMQKTDLISLFILYDVTRLYSRAKNRNVITGMLLSLFFKQIPVVQVETIGDVVYILKSLSSISKSETKNKYKLNVGFGKFPDLKARKIAALSCAENNGIVSGLLLINKFKTISNLIENVDEITEMQGFADGKKSGIIDLLTK